MDYIFKDDLPLEWVCIFLGVDIVDMDYIRYDLGYIMGSGTHRRFIFQEFLLIYNV